jgi:ABC-type molybdate transport system substrate-binding protein
VVEGDVWAKEPEILLFSGGVNRPAIESTLNAFAQREGCKLTRVYNGCGILVAQMKAGARPDAYFACDVSFMHQVQDLFFEAMNVSGTDILIAVPKGNPRGIASLEDLTKAGLKLGVANAEQSALGALTARMLEGAGLLPGVMANVRSQTPTADMLVNQLRAGGLDAVIVYEANISQVREHLDLVRIDLPSAKAVQPYAIAQGSQYKHLAQRLLDAITSTESQEKYDKAGFRWLYLSKKP